MKYPGYSEALGRLDLSALFGTKKGEVAINGRQGLVHFIVNSILDNNGTIPHTVEGAIGEIMGMYFHAINPIDSVMLAIYGDNAYLRSSMIQGLEISYIALVLLNKELEQRKKDDQGIRDLAALVQLKDAAFMVAQMCLNQITRTVAYVPQHRLHQSLTEILHGLNQLESAVHFTTKDREELSRYKEALKKLNKVWEGFTGNPIAFIQQFGATEEEAVPYVGILAQHMGDTYMSTKAWLEQTIEDGERFIAKAIRGEIDPSPAGRAKMRLDRLKAQERAEEYALQEFSSEKLWAPFSAEELSEILHGFVPGHVSAEEMIDAVLATDPAIQRAILALLRSPAGEVFPAIMQITQEMYGCLPQGSAAVGLVTSMECLAEMGSDTAPNDQPAQAVLQFLTDDGKIKTLQVNGSGPELMGMIRLLQKQPMIELEPGEDTRKYLQRLLGPDVEVKEMS